MKLGCHLLTIMHVGVCILCILQCVSSISSASFDFSVHLDNDNVQLMLGQSANISIFIDQLFDDVDTVSLRGEWVNTSPEQILVTFQPSTGITPFFSNITFLSSYESNPGVFHYKIYAEHAEINHTLLLTVNISTDLVVQLTTDKEEYFKGEQLIVSGNATTTENDLVTAGNVTITIYNNERTFTFLSQFNDTTFDYVYPISYGDLEGLWTISMRVVDDDGHVGIQCKNITVETPPDIMRYAVRFYSPPFNAVYRRGDTLDISVYITEDTVGIQNATTICILPTLQTITLVEYASGNYKQSYTIPWSTPIGEWFLTVESTKNVSGTFKAGGSTLPIIIESSLLKLTIVEPIHSQFSPGTMISLKVDVRYLDETFVENADIHAQTSNGNLVLEYEGNGVYTVNFSITSLDVGSQIIDIYAQDPYGNSGTVKKIIMVLSESQSPVMLFLIPLTAALICIIVVILYLRRVFGTSRLLAIQEEMIETKKQQESAAHKYFREGTISKETYDMLMYEHEQRYAQLQKEERKMLNK